MTSQLYAQKKVLMCVEKLLIIVRLDTRLIDQSFDI